jgi:hypothetical protein
LLEVLNFLVPSKGLELEAFGAASEPRAEILNLECQAERWQKGKDLIRK